MTRRSWWRSAGPRSPRSVAGASAALVGALSAIFAVVVGLVPPMLLLHVEKRNYPFACHGASSGGCLGRSGDRGRCAALVSRQPKAVQLLRPIA